jgi:hypothetical protein
MDIKESLALFRDFLNASWPTFLEYEKQYAESSFNDLRINWLQGNWELTVEQSVLQGQRFLQTYGDGADFGGSSCRVSFLTHCPLIISYVAQSPTAFSWCRLPIRQTCIQTWT